MTTDSGADSLASRRCAALAGSRPLRIALLTNMPTPYRAPCFNALHALLADQGHTLKCFFDVERESNRHWDAGTDQLIAASALVPGFSLRFKRRRASLGFADTREVHVGLTLAALLAFSADVVISCEFGARTLQALAYRALRRKPLIIWSEGTAHTEAEIPACKRRLRRFMVRSADGFWCNGSSSQALLMDYGASKRTIKRGMTGIAVEDFDHPALQALKARGAARARQRIHGRCFCFVGHYAASKGIPQYLAAIRELPAHLARRCTFLFVGSGPLVDAIEALRQAGLPVVDLGYRDNAALPSILALADVFVLPTLADNWSLASLEAAICGLPQLFSRYNGGSQDLCQAPADGSLFDPLDEREFVRCLSRMAEYGAPRLQRKRVLELSQRYCATAFAQRAVASIEGVAKLSKANIGEPA